jgi:hypothetical protein
MDHQDAAEKAWEAVARALWTLGETVGTAGRAAEERRDGTAVLSLVRRAHGELETALLAAMAVTHNAGAAPQGIAPLLGFPWDGWGEANRQSFQNLWGGIRSDASNAGDPALHKRLQQLWAVQDERDPQARGRGYRPPLDSH